MAHCPSLLLLVVDLAVDLVLYAPSNPAGLLDLRGRFFFFLSKNRRVDEPGDVLLGGELLGLPRVCSSGWEHARRPSEPDCAGQSAWDHHLLDFISNLQAKSPQGRSPPHAQHEHGTRNNLLKLKWA